MAMAADRRTFLARSLAGSLGGIGIAASSSPTLARTSASAGEAFVDIRDFGAVGDGVTDDTAAIQRTIDAVRAVSGGARGGTVVVPPGVWSVSSLEVGWCVALVGSGGSYGIGTGESPAGSVLTQRAGSTGPLLRSEPDGSKYVMLDRLCLDGTLSRRPVADTVGISGTFSNTDVRRCRVSGFGRWGIDIPTGNLVTIADCAVVGNGTAPDDAHGGVSLGCTEPIVWSNWVANNVGSGVRLTDAPIDGRVIGNTIEGYTPRAADAAWGLTLTFAQRIHVVANSIRGFNGGARLHKGGTGSKLIGNHLGDNSRALAGATPNLMIDPEDTDLESLLVLGNDFACEGRAVSAHVLCGSPQPDHRVRGVVVMANDFTPHERIQPRLGAMVWPSWSEAVSDIDIIGNVGDRRPPTDARAATGRGQRVVNTTRGPAVLVVATTTTPIRSVAVSGVRVFEAAAAVSGSSVPGEHRRFVTPPVPADGSVVIWTQDDEAELSTTWLPC